MKEQIGRGLSISMLLLAACGDEPSGGAVGVVTESAEQSLTTTLSFDDVQSGAAIDMRYRASVIRST